MTEQFDDVTVKPSIAFVVAVIVSKDPCFGGKRDGSRHHSTTSFSQKVVVAETSNQILQVFIVFNLRSGESLTSFNKDNSTNFSGEKSTHQYTLLGNCPPTPPLSHY